MQMMNTTNGFKKGSKMSVQTKNTAESVPLVKFSESNKKVEKGYKPTYFENSNGEMVLVMMSGHFNLDGTEK